MGACHNKGSATYVTKGKNAGTAGTQSNAVSASNVKIGDVLSKDNGRNQAQFEVLSRDVNGALLAVQESSFANSSRFAKGKTVVVDNAFLTSTTKGKLVKETKKAPNTKFTQAELNKMNRKKLESTALQVARKLASKQGISEAEAERRAKMLMSSNSDAQLRKYIKRNG
jgi:hypothetical protein